MSAYNVYKCGIMEINDQLHYVWHKCYVWIFLQKPERVFMYTSLSIHSCEAKKKSKLLVDTPLSKYCPKRFSIADFGRHIASAILNFEINT